MTRQWLYCAPGARCNTDLLLSANNLQKQLHQHAPTDSDSELVEKFEKFWQSHMKQPLAGRNILLSSICPQLHGLCMIKLAVMLMLIGGEQRFNKAGGQVRAELHMLLVGDPGTGNTMQIVQFAASLQHQVQDIRAQ